jgi:hypothetical protein
MPDKVRQLTQLHDAWLSQMAAPASGAGKKWDPANPNPPKKKNRNKNAANSPTGL